MRTRSNDRFYGGCLAGIASALMMAGTARADYQSVVLGDHPLAYYPLDFQVDTVMDANYNYIATDLSPYGMTGTYIGMDPMSHTLSGPSAIIPRAADFWGVDNWVELNTSPNAELLNIGGQITLEAWVRPNSSEVRFGNIIAKGYDASYNELALRQYGNVFQGPGGVSGPCVVDVWSHVVATYDGMSWNLYVNGRLTKSNPGSSGATQFASPWRIGNGSDDGRYRTFRGAICQAAIYNVGLTPEQVQLHYYSGKYGGTNFAPAILSEPVSGPPLYVGATARFKVDVDSVLPAGYQWYKGTTPLAGQTNASLVLTNIQANAAGNYNVVVTNSAGSITSAAAALTVVVPGVYGATVMADRPLAFYPLNESSDTVVTDYANGLNGTFRNSPTLGVSGPSAYIPSGVAFDGFNSWADLGNPAALNISGQITMEAWVQASATADGYIVVHGLGDYTMRELKLSATGSGFYVGEYPEGGGVGVGTTYQAGDRGANWVHLVGTYDGARWNIYRNGVLMASNPNTQGAITVDETGWGIGRSSQTGWGARAFQGAVSQVAIYDYALTPDRVMAHYHMGSVGTTNPPPGITSDLTARTVYAGGTLHLTVGIDSAIPVNYTWYKGTSVLVGQTNATLVLPNIQASDAGSYKATATSQAGSATSAAAQVTILTPGLYGAAVMADKPLAYYPLSESSGDTVFDYAGAFNGVYKTDPTDGAPPVLGVPGPSQFIPSSVSFYKSFADLSSYGNAAGMNFVGAIAMEAWVQPNDVWTDGNYDILAKGFSWSPYDEVQLRAKFDTYEAGCVYGGSVGGAPKTLGWTHLVATCDGTNWKIYANGALINQSSGVGVNSYPAPWAIANGSLDGAGRYFQGNICQVALYDHALSPAQVATHYELGKYGALSAPTVTTDPVSLVAYAGATARMSVVASSSTPMSYAWYKGASLLPSQTNATLVLANVQTSDTGSYSVVVSNAGGSDTSTAATLTVVDPGAYGAAVMADQPLAFYPLNETSGTTVVDYAGRGLNGTYRNWPVLGVNGPNTNITSGVAFDGSSSWADLGNPAVLNIAGQITMEAWVQAGINANGYILAHGLGDYSMKENTLSARDNGFYIGFYNNGPAAGATAPYQGADLSGNWVHVVGTYDGANWNIYRNGTLIASNPSANGAITVDETGWGIGRSSQTGWGARAFQGAISQVAIYNRALTAAQISTHFLTGQYGRVLPTPVVNKVTTFEGNLVFSGTIAANASYSVLSSTNVAAPMADWTLVETKTCDANGAFSVTNSVSSGDQKRFFRIKLP